MRILIVEDDLVSRKFLSKYLLQYGVVDVVVDGLEALEAYSLAIKDKSPYDFICLDIMMPKIDGVKVLKAIRDYEVSKGLLPQKRVKVVLTTALAETDFVKHAFEIGCEAYLCKPIETDKLKDIMEKLGLI